MFVYNWSTQYKLKSFILIFWLKIKKKYIKKLIPGSISIKAFFQWCYI